MNTYLMSVLKQVIVMALSGKVKYFLKKWHQSHIHFKFKSHLSNVFAFVTF